MLRSCSRSGARRAGRLAAWGVALAAVALACGTLSVQQERQLGDEFEREARRSFTFLRDRVVRGYVRQIGDAIVLASAPHPFEYSFEVIEDEEINAFAGPGGHIYVHTGTILKARNVSELAGVIAHEVGHVARRHIAENYNRQRTTGIAHQAAVLATSLLAGGNAAGAVNLLGGLAGMAYLNTFTREAEAEADQFAIEVLPKVHYDPNGMVSFFETLKAEGDVNIPGFLRSHPTTDDRIAAVQAAIHAERLPENLRVHDRGRLEIIQRRIRILIGEE
ncbi:MAG: M48 family metalloprotease [Deltaproteobacteria bacterium]|nr:MAG: M48 family metalloprotease [Deltaproteobacteria bacterium]